MKNKMPKTKEEMNKYKSEWQRNRLKDPLYRAQKNEKYRQWIKKRNKKGLRDELFNIEGNRYNRLTVISKSHSKRGSYWLCECDCGRRKIVLGSNLKNGITKSCGCLVNDTAFLRRTHYDTKSKEYKAWISMKARCYNPKNEDYPNYGGRGIIMCERWKESYEKFLEDMGRAPSKEYSIDRIDSDGIYEKINCRWVTIITQANNRRSNIIISYNGESFRFAIICRELNLDYERMHRYIKVQNLSFEEALIKYNNKIKQYDSKTT